MAKQQVSRGGVVGIVSAVNGLVVPIPSGSAGVVARLAIKENAEVISAKRTKQLLSGDVPPEEMTDVLDGAATDRGLAEDLANRIDADALHADIGNTTARDERQEPKKPRGKTAAQRAAEARDAAAEDLSGASGEA